METIGTLAGGIAHDFNNILTSMIGCTELAIRRCGDDERLGKYLGVVRDGERRASELVAQILTFARQDKTLIMAPLQLAETISEIMTLLRASIPATADIRTSIAENCPLVMANSSQIHQVVMNLMTNAYQSLPEGKGILDVELREERVTVKDATKLLKIKPGEYLVLSITDNGCGMSAEQMERIFDPYFTTRHINDGTGFGLTIVQKVIQAHTGAVMVKSVLDEGSVFEVYLPLHNEEGISLPADAEEDDRVEQISGDEHILLVDDEAEIRFVFKEGLEELGYRVVVARDADQALVFLNESPLKFDAIVSDMTMPAMSGVDLAKMVQQVDEFIPVVLMSGYVQNGICEEPEHVNILEVLQKPIDVEGVARALRRVLAQSENKRDSMAAS
jgi:CheY-like chemotaxis protein/two-component sensor histidine kinase